MFFGGYKHSFLLHSFLEMELLSRGITESLIFPLKPIFLEFPHIRKCHHHPPNCSNPSLSAISPSTPSLFTHLWVPLTPKCNLNLLLYIATTNLLLNSPYKGLQKWLPKCLRDSTFVLLKSSLHSSQGFRNVNRIISFACFKPSFKFPVKSEVRSWLSKSYFFIWSLPETSSPVYGASASSGLPSWVTSLIPRALALVVVLNRGYSPDLCNTSSFSSLRSRPRSHHVCEAFSEHLIWCRHLVTGFHNSVV